MGHYTRFKIGPCEWSFKYQVPHFLIFIFDEEEFYFDEEIVDGELQYYNFLGYRTTGEAVLKKLDKYGFDFNFLEEIYREFEEDIESLYSDAIEEAPYMNCIFNYNEDYSEEEIEKYSSDKIGQISKSAYDQFFDENRSDIEIFVDFLNICSDTEKFKLFILKMAEMGASFPRGNEDSPFKPDGNDLIDNIWSFATNYILYLPPEIVKVAEFLFLLEDDFPDIVGFFFARTILSVYDSNITVEVDLSDIIEPIEDAQNMHQWIQDEILRKINLYNKTFRCLTSGDQALHQIFIKQKLSKSIVELSQISDKYEKGKNFEDFIRQLFSINPEFIFFDSNVNLKDEEIDLIYRNNSNRPFWMSFHSPQIFIECKYWQKRVEAKHFGIFEGKLIDHSNLCKIGIFISMSGFTSGFNEKLKRMGRDDHTIILISGDDIIKFLNTSIDFYDWLENLVSSSIK